jgi:hypothetical protein
MRTWIPVVLAVAGFAGAAAPARAEAAWTDAKGDATALPGVESTPRPSDPELDIVASSYRVVGDSIVATTRVERLGVAVGSGGTVFHFRFTYKNDEYYLQGLTGSAEYQQLFLNNPRFYRAAKDEVSDPEELRCDCKFATDPKSHSATFTIKTEAVAKPLKASAGTMELKNLNVRTFRRINFYVDADISRAPEKLTFRA